VFKKIVPAGAVFLNFWLFCTLFLLNFVHFAVVLNVDFIYNDAYSSDEFPITSELKSRLKSSEGGSRTMNEILEKLISDEKRESELRGEERGEKRGRKEGKIEGANEEKLRIAKDMKASGLAFDFIARFTGLTEDAVAALQS